MSAFSDYFSDMMPEARLEVHSCPELMELIGAWDSCRCWKAAYGVIAPRE